eukprot:c10409_g1_i2 orf=37-369(-)
MTSWLDEHGPRMDNLPPFKCDTHSPYTRLSQVDRNWLLRSGLIQLQYIPERHGQHWATPPRWSTSDSISCSSQRMVYTVASIHRYFHVTCDAGHIGQLRVSLHTLKIAVG